MKKALCLLLALILTLALLPTAFAELEPDQEAEGTPYGIPLFETIDDVDFTAVIEGHRYKRLLDLFDNIEVKMDLHQDQQGDIFDMLIDDYYFRDNGQYVHYSEQMDKTYNSMSYQLFLYDKEEPFYYMKHMGGRDKYEVPAEYVDGMLNGLVCGLSPTYFDFVINSAEVVDGLYVFQFDMVPNEEMVAEYGEPDVSYSDCSLTIDPETSLIRAYSYHQVSEHADAIYNAELFFNVDKEPDYSLKY